MILYDTYLRYKKKYTPRVKAVAHASSQGRKWIPRGRKIGF